MPSVLNVKVLHALTTSSSVLTQVFVSTDLRFVTVPITVEICLTNRTAVSYFANHFNWFTLALYVA